MKRFNILLILIAIILTTSVSAQVVSKDSITTLKQQTQASEIGKRLNTNKLELAKLENSLEQKSRDSESSAEKAQQSADNNSKEAANLSNDAQDKKLARKASKSARVAKHDAKDARKADASLDGLKKNIEILKRKIADDEAKLVSIANNKG